MNYPIKKLLWIAAVVGLLVLTVMFIIPVMSAVLLVFLGLIGLLMFSRWVAKLFRGDALPEDNYDTNYSQDQTGRSKSIRRLGRLGKSRVDIEDAEIIVDEQNSKQK